MKAYKGRGYVYYLHYHIVWCVKDRHNILNGEMERNLKEIVIEIAHEQKIKIIKTETDNDHIHLFVDCTTRHSFPNESLKRNF